MTDSRLSKIAGHGLHYIGRKLPMRRSAFTAFIAYAFGHNLSPSAVTAAAVRFRLYSGYGLSLLDVAKLGVFCSVTTGLGLATLGAVSLFVAPDHAAQLLHLSRNGVLLSGAAVVTGITCYALWAGLANRGPRIRGWELHPPGWRILLPQLLLSLLDISLAACVLWSLLPTEVHVGFFTFAGAYAIAAMAGIVSHVPGGLGVFEMAIGLVLPQLPASDLLGALLAYRAIYYLAPLLIAAVLFGVATRGRPADRPAG